MRSNRAFAVLFVPSLAIGVTVLSQYARAAGDPARGASVFQQCSACHSIVAGDHMTGPSLAKIWLKKAGTVEQFGRYSDAMKRSDVVWNEPTLDARLVHAIDELDAHAFSAPQFERRPEVTRHWTQGVGAALQHLRLEAQHARCRARPDRYAIRCGDEPDRDIGRHRSECFPQTGRHEKGARPSGERLQRPASTEERVARVATKRFPAHGLRADRYRLMVAITSGRSHCAGPM